MTARPALRLAAVLLLARSAPARAEDARLDSIATAFARQGFAGAVFVTRGSDTLLDRGYGEADRERHVANGPGVRYRIGSLTKQFTAAAIMRLVEQGRLGTRDPIRRWVPEASPAWSSVTLRHLLSHTGGIPDAQDDSDFVRAGRLGNPGQLAARRYSDRPLDFPPGTRFAYSNTDYLLLGAVVEAASGERYERFLERELLVPLGLTDTDFGAAASGAAAVAVGYWNRAGGSPAPVSDLGMVYAAGALLSTTHDLVSWERALLGDRVLRGATKTEMLTPVIRDYAYGIHHRTGPGREVYYHVGKLDGFESLLGWYPADSVAIAVLANQVGGWRINQFYDALAAASALGDQRERRFAAPSVENRSR